MPEVREEGGSMSDRDDLRRLVEDGIEQGMFTRAESVGMSTARS